jgi:hypothetical protein
MDDGYNQSNPPADYELDWDESLDGPRRRRLWNRWTATGVGVAGVAIIAVGAFFVTKAVLDSRVRHRRRGRRYFR